MTENTTQTKKKVLFFITKSNFGGAQKYVYDLATNLDTSFESVVVSGGNGLLFEKLKEHSIRTLHIPDLKRNISVVAEIKSFFNFIKILHVEKPDVLHLNSPKAGGIGALAGRITGIKKIIYTAHGWPFYEDRPLYQQSLIQFFSYLTVLFVDTVITVSKKDVHAFDGWLFTKNKIKYIPNGVVVEHGMSKENARELLKTYGIPTESFLIGSVAELTKNKGLSYLVETAKEFPDAVFIIIGEGSARKELEKHIEKHAISKRFFLLGFIENAGHLIPAFDVFVLPSIKEGLPYVLLEAGISETAVVATSVGGIPEIIEHEVTGMLVKPADSFALTTALKRLIGDEPFRKTLARQLKRKVTDNYSQEKMITETVRLYTD